MGLYSFTHTGGDDSNSQNLHVEATKLRKKVPGRKFCNNLGNESNLLYAVAPRSPLDLSDKPSCGTYSPRHQVKGKEASATALVIPFSDRFELLFICCSVTNVYLVVTQSEQFAA